jgi:hypothetical protein
VTPQANPCHSLLPRVNPQVAKLVPRALVAQGIEQRFPNPLQASGPHAADLVLWVAPGDFDGRVSGLVCSPVRERPCGAVSSTPPADLAEPWFRPSLRRTSHRPVVTFIKSATFDCADALVAARFSAAALDGDLDGDSTSDKACVEAPGWGGANLWFQRLPERGRSRIGCTSIFAHRTRWQTRCAD